MTSYASTCGALSGFCNYTRNYLKLGLPQDAGDQRIIHRSGDKHIFSIEPTKIFVRDTNNSYSNWTWNNMVIPYDHDIYHSTTNVHDVFNEIPSGSDFRIIDSTTRLSFLSADENQKTYKCCWRSARLYLRVQNATVVKMQNNSSGRLFDLSNAVVDWYQALPAQISALPSDQRPFYFPEGKNFLSRKNGFKSYKSNYNPVIPVFENDGARIGLCVGIPHNYYVITRLQPFDYRDICFAGPEGGPLQIISSVPGSNDCGTLGRFCNSNDECKNLAGTYNYQYHYTHFDKTLGPYIDFTEFNESDRKKKTYIDLRVAGIFPRFINQKNCICNDETYSDCDNCVSHTCYSSYDCKDGYLFWNSASEQAHDFTTHIFDKLSTINLAESNHFFSYSDTGSGNYRPPILGSAFDFAAVFDVYRKVTFSVPAKPIGYNDNNRQAVAVSIADDQYCYTDMRSFYVAQLVTTAPVQQQEETNL